MNPLGDQFAALIPEHIDTHPLGCHNPRIPDRVVFDKLVRNLASGASGSEPKRRSRVEREPA